MIMAVGLWHKEQGFYYVLFFGDGYVVCRRPGEEKKRSISLDEFEWWRAEYKNHCIIKSFFEQSGEK